MTPCLMRYKDFTWPNNPKTLKVTQQRNVKELYVPFCGGVLQDYGGGKRVVAGEGEFFGESCMKSFLQLSALLQKGGSGCLYLPGMTPFSAVFRSLELTQEPQENLLRYAFTFWEEQNGSGSAQGDSKFHITAEGETLWSIAADYGMTVDTLLRLNGYIRRPDKLEAGQKVMLA